MSYGNLFHYGNVSDDASLNKWTNIVMDDGWVHPLAITLASLVSNLWWNIVMDDWNLDENHFAFDNNCNTANF